MSEEPDVVDSDFDVNSTEEDSSEDAEAEASIALEEKRQKKVWRQAYRDNDRLTRSRQQVVRRHGPFLA